MAGILDAARVAEALAGAIVGGGPHAPICEA